MSVVIHTGNAMAVLSTLPAESVHCCVTSPPYWGLRDYGTARWEGGKAHCDHLRPPLGGDGRTSRLNARYADDGTFDGKQHPRLQQYADECGKCGARRIDQALGLEPTPEVYVDRMVAVFREVRRMLRNDGTLWLNLGDSYAAAAGGGQGKNGLVADRSAARLGVRETHFDRSKVAGLKPKDLVGIPWRVAFALQADGWWLRSDIIWAKPNPMPESVTDRPTKSHEYVFLLAKSAQYYYDADAVRVAHARLWDESNGGSWRHGVGDAQRVAERGKAGTHSGPYPLPNPGGRNLRTVWQIATKPYHEAHFATFPPQIPELCIKAGCPEGGTVLDPFAGAGTTLLVADRLGRNAIGIELNPKYVALARKRVFHDAPLFAKVEVIDETERNRAAVQD